MLNIRFPRLLPITIAAVTFLLMLKLVAVLDAVRSDHTASDPLLAGGVAMVSVANAASPEAAPAATPAAAAAPGPAKPADAATKAAPAAPPPAGDKAAVASEAPPVSDSERALLLDLRQRRLELDAREGGLGSRETMLVAAEHRLSTRIDELTALQTRLEALEKSRKEREEANWAGLVTIYKDMRPRDAAAIFNGLDTNVLLEVLDRMKERNTAPILAAMQPDKARQATDQLAQLRLKRNTIGG